jgi:capsular polysaccharide biosynthesis protein
MREVQETVNASIDLRDIVDFFKRNQKIIALFCIAGLLCGVTYSVFAPKKYEARWQLQMAFFSNSNSEEPEALVQRLHSQTTYPIEVRQVCGLVDEDAMHDFLDKDFEVRSVKNVAASVEGKLRASSVAQAQQCAEAIVAMISAQQVQIIGERMAGRYEQLGQYQRAFQDEQQQLANIASTELGRFAYLAKLDKLSWLRSRVDALQEETLLSLKHPTKLTAPIFVSSKAVSPKVPLVILIGILLGLMVGVLSALSRENVRRTIK